MIRLASAPAIMGMRLGEEPEQTDGFSLEQKVKGPRRLLADLLRQDPAMAELLKNMRLKGNINGSMDGNVDESGY